MEASTCKMLAFGCRELYKMSPNENIDMQPTGAALMRGLNIDGQAQAVEMALHITDVEEPEPLARSVH
jgi:hypothetical protein